MTYREQFDSAMKCETPEETSFWMDKEVHRYVREYGKTPEESRQIIKANLGYMAGYFDESYSQKVLQLFGAAHPIFGTERPSNEEALIAGMVRAKSPQIA